MPKATRQLSLLPQLPLEILFEIFSLACTDGGRTGCALSSVSRHFREASKHVRFQSVSITGLDTLWAFLLVIRDVPNTNRRVTFLRIEEFSEGHHSFRKAYDRQQTFGPVLEEVLRIVAPSLKVLHIRRIALDLTSMTRWSLPELIELTARDCTQIGRSVSVSFPRLRYLELWDPSDDILRNLSSFPKSITHICITTSNVTSTYDALAKAADNSPQFFTSRIFYLRSVSCSTSPRDRSTPRLNTHLKVLPVLRMKSFTQMWEARLSGITWW